MSEFLVIRLEEDPAQASWLILSDQGHRLSRTTRGSLSEAATDARNREVLLLVPGIDAVTTRVTLPVKRQSRIEQMLPYQLEDAVAEDVDSLLFAAGPRREGGSIPVAIVARDLVDAWLADCAEAGISVDSVFVDLQGVPEIPSNLTLVLEGQKIYGRLPDREPFLFEDLSLVELMEVLAAEPEPSPYLKNIIVYADDPGLERYGNELDRLRENASSVDISVLPDGVLPRLAATFVSDSGSNLLQGPYRVRSDWSELLRPWRLPAGLAIALFAAATVGLAGRYYVLSEHDQALTDQLEANCGDAFGTSGLAECEDEIRRRLGSSGGDGGSSAENGFLQTLATVAQARDQRMLVQALSFRDGVTNLRLTAPDVQSLDDLARALASGGRYQANIQSSVPAEQGVEGRMQIAGVDP